MFNQEVWFLYRNANHSKFFKLRSNITKNMPQTPHPTPHPGGFSGSAHVKKLTIAKSIA